MSYATHLAEHRRLCILRVLAAAPGYSSNESLLTDMANELGVTASRDQVRGELAWLSEQGLVAVEEVAGIMIARVLPRGIDVAEGRAVVPGVKRPSPKG